MNLPSVGRWRNNFFTGLAVLLPAILSILIFLWLFNTIRSITDRLLFPLPRSWTHANDGTGPMLWYWSLLALLLTVLLITLVGRLARHYFGRKLIKTIEGLLLRIPLLGKIYATLKQVNEAFSTNSKSAFRQVVLIPFPNKNMHSVGFITGEQHAEVQARTATRVVSVFVPTTPNPTTGFLVLVPETDVVRLNMSVADGIKFIISLGSVSPEYSLGSDPAAAGTLPTASTDRLAPIPPSTAAPSPPGP